MRPFQILFHNLYQLCGYSLFKYLEKLSKQLSNLNQKAQISVYNAKLTFHNFYQFSMYYERT